MTDKEFKRLEEKILVATSLLRRYQLIYRHETGRKFEINQKSKPSVETLDAVKNDLWRAAV